MFIQSVFTIPDQDYLDLYNHYGLRGFDIITLGIKQNIERQYIEDYKPINEAPYVKYIRFTSFGAIEIYKSPLDFIPSNIGDYKHTYQMDI